jgi:hypothetical protein
MADQKKKPIPIGTQLLQFQGFKTAQFAMYDDAVKKKRMQKVNVDGMKAVWNAIEKTLEFCHESEALLRFAHTHRKLLLDIANKAADGGDAQALLEKHFGSVEEVT